MSIYTELEIADERPEPMNSSDAIDGYELDDGMQPPSRIVLTYRSLLVQLAEALSSDDATYQSVVSFADQAVTSLANFATGVIIARSCSKAELGLYMLGFSLILLVTDLQTSLITTPYMIYAPRLRGKAHALYTGSTLIHQLVFCFITMLGVILGAVLVHHGGGQTPLGRVLTILAPVIALIMLREHARRISFARLQLGTAFIFDFCIAVGQISGLLILGRLHLLSTGRAFCVVGLLCGIAVAGWLWFDRAFYSPQLANSIGDLKRNWALGKWIFASGLVWALGMNLYPWLLAVYHGVASAGIWAACLGVISVINPVLLAYQNLAGPRLSHTYAVQGPSALRRLALRISALIAAPLALVCIAMLFCGGGLASLIYGPRYSGNGAVITLLAVNLMFTAFAFSFSRALFAINRADVDFFVNLTTLFIMLTFGLWMVRDFGPVGAAIGLIGGSIVAAAVRATAFLRLSDRMVTIDGRAL